MDMRSMYRHCTSRISSDLTEPFAAAIRCGDDVQLNAIFDVLSSSPSDVRALVNRVLDDGSTPLNVAIAFRHFDVARRLMDCGSDVDLPDSFRLDGCRRKPVHYACAVGCVELVRTFIEQFNVDVDEPDDGNATPIHHAAATGQIGRPVVWTYMHIVDYKLTYIQENTQLIHWLFSNSNPKCPPPPK